MTSTMKDDNTAHTSKIIGNDKKNYSPNLQMKNIPRPSADMTEDSNSPKDHPLGHRSATRNSRENGVTPEEYSRLCSKISPDDIPAVPGWPESPNHHAGPVFCNQLYAEQLCRNGSNFARGVSQPYQSAALPSGSLETTQASDADGSLGPSGGPIPFSGGPCWAGSRTVSPAERSRSRQTSANNGMGIPNGGFLSAYGTPRHRFIAPQPFGRCTLRPSLPYNGPPGFDGGPVGGSFVPHGAPPYGIIGDSPRSGARGPYTGGPTLNAFPSARPPPMVNTHFAGLDNGGGLHVDPMADVVVLCLHRVVDVRQNDPRLLRSRQTTQFAIIPFMQHNIRDEAITGPTLGPFPHSLNFPGFQINSPVIRYCYLPDYRLGFKIVQEIVGPRESHSQPVGVVMLPHIEQLVLSSPTILPEQVINRPEFRQSLPVVTPDGRKQYHLLLSRLFDFTRPNEILWPHPIWFDLQSEEQLYRSRENRRSQRMPRSTIPKQSATLCGATYDGRPSDRKSDDDGDDELSESSGCVTNRRNRENVSRRNTVTNQHRSLRHLPGYSRDYNETENEEVSMFSLQNVADATLRMLCSGMDTLFTSP